ncbi:hypothetical protein BCU70_19530 [Vibrio sp. 10N.286.49.C2]|uniref:hypothetical protein n=1 Tax=unclassified Vibrio TaxID=2614977 RepID=UPI000CB08918|nr:MULTISPECIES: hypothetical protein [unclassified Vibrio]PMH34853.1 hypothetical protein BCU70_19530 [Vibrio sp. 10N.286.49.C2]PMH51359.1 hypothetical protein BCU66_16585 [Vibrio sp. 10N.286.49.B1]PMH78647.1 hypothetical protein BCU58_08350 [Vibrio sp. 10N.286.48.B7]
MRKKMQWISIIPSFLILGCSSYIPPEERQAARDDINTASSEIISKLEKDHTEISTQLADSVGYATISMSGVKVPVIGGGSGVGAIYSSVDDNVTYINVDRYDVGAGLALGNYEALAIFDNKEDLEKYRKGVWHVSVGAELSYGESRSSAATTLIGTDDSDVPIYLLSSSGGAAIGSARLISSSVNYDLTETGVGDISIANKDQDVADGTTAPKKWDRALPFFAQEVIDKGYSLPKPYGISLIYTNTFQYMDITDLNVGINGSKQYPIEFVSFDNNSNSTQSPQLKLDAWLFPFMNVFGAVGKISGTADIGIQISGDDLIDQTGADCTGPIIGRPPQCIFQGREIGGVAKATLDGTNYTLGTILATGWNDYFVTLPVSFTYADMRKNDAEGLILNVSPRVGKVFPTVGSQSVAVYTGATYLDSTLTLTGTYTYEGVGIDYKVKQSNIDKWTGLVGANYNFNRDWSLMMEYGWKSDRKRQFISALNRRF